MAIRTGKPVAAGLSQVAQMDRRERARIVRQLCQQHPAFRSLITQVTVARAVSFAAGLSLAVAVMLLVNQASAWWVSAFVFVGLAGFCYVAVVLTDSRFDLLLAVLGAHRTDELYGRLVTDELYGAEGGPHGHADPQRASEAGHAQPGTAMSAGQSPGVPGHAS